jgi:chemotaxis response regulator CheB
MRPKAVRVLCVDSMEGRRRRLVASLEQIGLEVWTARNVADAFFLVEGLRPSAIVIDQDSTLHYAMEWNELVEASPNLPVLLHSANAGLGADSHGAVRTGNPEVITAILSILLGPEVELGAMSKVA